MLENSVSLSIDTACREFLTAAIAELPAIAAVKNSRHAVSIDRDTEFSNIAEHRLKSFYNGEIKTRPIEKPIYSQKKGEDF